MKLLFAIPLCVLAVSAPARDPKAPKPTPAPTDSPAVRRLKEIEMELRSRAGEAEAEVREAREKAARITKEAEEESARIKAEADAYTQKVKKEIEDIRKRDLTDLQKAPRRSGPDRARMSEALASLVDPLLLCWDSEAEAIRRHRPFDVETCAMAQVRERLKGFFRK